MMTRRAILQAAILAFGTTLGSVLFDTELALAGTNTVTVNGLPVDVYQPSRPNGRGIVLVHGGMFTAGKRGSMAGVAQAFASAGFLAVAPDYRLAPAHTYPAQADDVRAVVEWVRARVSKREVIGFGASAGATCAAWSGGLKALIALSGLWDFPAFMEAYNCDPPAVVGSNDAADISPIEMLDPATTPPTLLFNSTSELMPLDQATTYCDAIRDVGVRCDLEILEGDRHAMGYVSDPIVGASIKAFLSEVLRPA